MNKPTIRVETRTRVTKTLSLDGKQIEEILIEWAKRELGFLANGVELMARHDYVEGALLTCSYGEGGAEDVVLGDAQNAQNAHHTRRTTTDTAGE